MNNTGEKVDSEQSLKEQLRQSQERIKEREAKLNTSLIENSQPTIKLEGWYRCHQCEVGHATDNMSAYCASCVDGIKRELKLREQSLASVNEAFLKERK